MSKKIALSIVIPAFNEERNVELLYARIKETIDRMGKEYEIIFIDDGSEDNTFQLLLEINEQDSRVRLIRFKKKSGQTAALDAGIRAARGDVLITMDADLQNDPADIPHLLERLNEADVVSGWRYKRADSFLKIASSRIANFVRNWVTGENIIDTGCSLRAYKKACMDRLKLFDGMHRFLPTLLKMEGFKVIEVKVSHFPRRYGRSKYNIRNRLFRGFIDLLAVCWMKKRKLNYEIEVMK